MDVVCRGQLQSLHRPETRHLYGTCHGAYLKHPRPNLKRTGLLPE
jgi:hypothetical protein